MVYIHHKFASHSGTFIKDDDPLFSRDICINCNKTVAEIDMDFFGLNNKYIKEKNLSFRIGKTLQCLSEDEYAIKLLLE